jgi:HptB-dependent secretion and biofilm anti anti-sigma factor
MSIHTRTTEVAITIQLDKDFTFHYQAEFRKAYEQNIDEHTKSVLIDFARTDFIDSAALGMLLVLHEYVGKNEGKTTIELINCKKEVFEILEISNFSKLFSIPKAS